MAWYGRALQGLRSPPLLFRLPRSPSNRCLATGLCRGIVWYLVSKLCLDGSFQRRSGVPCTWLCSLAGLLVTSPNCRRRHRCGHMAYALLGIYGAQSRGCRSALLTRLVGLALVALICSSWTQVAALTK